MKPDLKSAEKSVKEGALGFLGQFFDQDDPPDTQCKGFLAIFSVCREIDKTVPVKTAVRLRRSLPIGSNRKTSKLKVPKIYSF